MQGESNAARTGRKPGLRRLANRQLDWRDSLSPRQDSPLELPGLLKYMEPHPNAGTAPGRQKRVLTTERMRR